MINPKGYSFTHIPSMPTKARIVICPVCFGSGGYYTPSPENSTSVVWWICQKCGGKGKVTEFDDVFWSETGL